jgi:hypothetical protein
LEDAALASPYLRDRVSELVLYHPY